MIPLYFPAGHLLLRLLLLLVLLLILLLPPQVTVAFMTVWFSPFHQIVEQTHPGIFLLDPLAQHF